MFVFAFSFISFSSHAGRIVEAVQSGRVEVLQKALVDLDLQQAADRQDLIEGHALASRNPELIALMKAYLLENLGTSLSAPKLNVSRIGRFVDMARFLGFRYSNAESADLREDFKRLGPGYQPLAHTVKDLEQIFDALASILHNRVVLFQAFQSSEVTLDSEAVVAEWVDIVIRLYKRYRVHLPEEQLAWLRRILASTALCVARSGSPSVARYFDLEIGLEDLTEPVLNGAIFSGTQYHPGARDAVLNWIIRRDTLATRGATLTLLQNTILYINRPENISPRYVDDTKALLLACRALDPGFALRPFAGEGAGLSLFQIALRRCAPSFCDWLIREFGIPNERAADAQILFHAVRRRQDDDYCAGILPFIGNVRSDIVLAFLRPMLIQSTGVPAVLGDLVLSFMSPRRVTRAPLLRTLDEAINVEEFLGQIIRRNSGLSLRDEGPQPVLRQWVALLDNVPRRPHREVATPAMPVTPPAAASAARAAAAAALVLDPRTIQQIRDLLGRPEAVTPENMYRDLVSLMHVYQTHRASLPPDLRDRMLQKIQWVAHAVQLLKWAMRTGCRVVFEDVLKWLAYYVRPTGEDAAPILLFLRQTLAERIRENDTFTTSLIVQYGNLMEPGFVDQPFLPGSLTPVQLAYIWTWHQRLPNSNLLIWLLERGDVTSSTVPSDELLRLASRPEHSSSGLMEILARRSNFAIENWINPETHLPVMPDYNPSNFEVMAPNERRSLVVYHSLTQHFNTSSARMGGSWPDTLRSLSRHGLINLVLSYILPHSRLAQEPSSLQAVVDAENYLAQLQVYHLPAIEHRPTDAPLLVVAPPVGEVRPRAADQGEAEERDEESHVRKRLRADHLPTPMTAAAAAVMALFGASGMGSLGK